MHSRSSVVSFRVFLFMTCVRLLSCNISRSCWCSEASGLLGMTAGVFQSMWPRLKSPLTQMLEFVFLHKTLFSEIPSCSIDSPLSDGVDSMCKGKVICCLHMIFLPTHFRSLDQTVTNRFRF